MLTKNPTAPDALAQVKKGLRGLFKNRKQKGQQQGEAKPSSTSQASPATASAAAPAAAAAPVAASGAPEDTKSGTYSSSDLTGIKSSHRPDPAAQSQPSELSPVAATSPSIAATPVTQSAQATESTQTGPHLSEPSKLEDAKAGDLKPEPASDMKSTSAPLTAPSTRMSATSGPMGDHMAEVFHDTETAAEEGETKVS